MMDAYSEKHHGYGYNSFLNRDYYGAPPYYWGRKTSEVIDPVETVEIGGNYELPGYTVWNGDSRRLLQGSNAEFNYNCAIVHTRMPQVLWLDGHASRHTR